MKKKGSKISTVRLLLPTDRRPHSSFDLLQLFVSRKNKEHILCRHILVGYPFHKRQGKQPIELSFQHCTS